MNNNFTEIFKEIETARSLDQIRNLWTVYLSKNPFPLTTYPDFELSISKTEIDQLLEEDKLNSDNEIHEEFLSDNKKSTPLEKLLFAVIWKNGDLKKIKHIVNGIQGQTLEKTTAKVFTQFGKYLTDEKCPIIDQHVLRAYKVLGENIELKDIKRSSKIRNQDLKYIESYGKWANKIADNIPNENRRNIFREIDKILFVIGKLLKKEMKHGR